MNLTLLGAPLTLCPRRYGTPHIAIVTYYLLRVYPNCAPGSKNSEEFFFCFGSEDPQHPPPGERRVFSKNRLEKSLEALRLGGARGGLRVTRKEDFSRAGFFNKGLIIFKKGKRIVKILSEFIPVRALAVDNIAHNRDYHNNNSDDNEDINF